MKVSWVSKIPFPFGSVSSSLIWSTMQSQFKGRMQALNTNNYDKLEKLERKT